MSGLNEQMINGLSYSSHEFEFLNSNIQTFFGDKFTFLNSIKRYENYIVFQQHMPVGNIDEIGEVYNNDIYRLVKTEEYFNEKVKRIQKEFEEYEHKDIIPEDKIIYFAQELGLYPKENQPIYKHIQPYNVLTNAEFDKWFDECRPFRKYNADSLYCNLIPFYLMTNDEIEEYKTKFKDNIQKMPFLFHYLFDDMLENFMHVHDDGRVCVEFGYSRFYFRGENAFYGSSKAGLYRNKDIKDIDNIDIIISIIKMLELNRLCDMIKTNPQGVHIYGSAMAQHYGLTTHCIDLTSDIKVALFFACCKYDNSQKKYVPLTEKDFAYKNSRRKSKEFDSRFGVLYKVPSDLVKMSNAIPDGPYKKIHSIGYQPYLRSENQKGYLMETDKLYNMYKDRSFEKYKFRLNEELCNWIYKEMDGGNKLFPEEAFNDITDIIAEINKLEEFDLSILDFVYQNYKVLLGGMDIEEFKNALEVKGHKGIENKQWCSLERLKELQEKWRDKFNMEKFINLKYRLTFSI